MSPEASDPSSFLRPFWNRLAIQPWLLFLLVLAVLAAARFYSAFGPPQARILFLLHILVMWTLPFLFLTRQGRRDVGLCRKGITPVALVLCSLAGVAGGLLIFWIGMALYGNSPDNWCVSIRDSFQLNQMLAVMSPAAAFAVIALLTMSFTPIGEEFLFRGLIQKSFTLRWNAAIATLVNGFAYGLLHLLHVHGLWHNAAGFHLRLISGALVVLLLAGLGATFTLCRLCTGSLWCAVVAHAACNLAMISAIFLHFVH
ncbi:MAG: CPBP family intramembrane glutamic endopeptidase [Terracidiphilus sp.]|jgi:membrane protease YdiL (CAAX protease family)